MDTAFNLVRDPVVKVIQHLQVEGQTQTEYLTSE